jgi:DNA repair exonuclease SbcCD ATPase subunit
MLFLLQQLWWLLPLAAIAAGFAGWRLHLILSAPRLRALEQERNRLRTEFEGYASGERIGGLRKATDERELAFLRTRESIAGAKVVELDRALAEVREQRDVHAGRAAELERALDAAAAERAAASARSEAAEAELSRLRAASNADEMNALSWRLRYFEARTRYLEQHAAAPAPGEDVEALRKARDAARTEADELRAHAAAQLEANRRRRLHAHSGAPWRALRRCTRRRAHRRHKGIARSRRRRSRIPEAARTGRSEACA